ncbi:Extracellular serine protease precursor [bacterium YEK0313]|nr:Extracellular serine protease precursor [bacterium YEK0313]
MRIGSGGTGGGAGLFLYGGGSLINEDGMIVGGAGGAVRTGGDAGVGGAGVLTNRGTITNRGSIEGGRGGEQLAGAGSGPASGAGGAGIEAWGATITNEGAGRILGGAAGALRDSRPGRGGAGVILRDGWPSSLVNDGRIEGGLGGSQFTVGSRIDGGAGGSGVEAGGGEITNNAMGRISGGSGGTGTRHGGEAGVGVLFRASGRLVNAGEIAGGSGGWSEGQGDGARGGDAAVLQNGGTVTNTGRLQGGRGGNGFDGSGGAGGTGVRASDAAITNVAGAEIIGGDGGAGSGLVHGAGGAGIAGSGLTITNGGSISGGLGADGTTRAASLALMSGASRLTMGPAGKLEGAIDIAGGASLTLDQSDNDATIGVVITGAGSLIKTGTATVVLSATATHSGGTTIREGVLAAGGSNALGSGAVTLDGGTLRASSGLILNNELTINRWGGTLDAGATGIAVNGAISDGDGPGTLTIAGTATSLSGWVVFATQNSYASATHITAGAGLSGMIAGSLSPNSDHIVDGTLDTAYAAAVTLRSLAGAATGRVVALGPDDRTLTLAMPSGTADFAGTIFDSSDGGRVSVVKTGAGHQIFSGTNSYTGNTTVDGGTLSVNGSVVASPLVTVNASGTLGGTGTVGETIVNAGGTLAPGNSIGTLTVQGNLTFAAGSTYAIEVSPLGSDRVNVSGTATLGGATVAASYAPGAYVTKRYTILTAGSISGAFAGPVNTNLPANFSVALKQDATRVHLDLTLNYVPGGPDPGGPNPGGPNPGGPNPGGPDPGGPVPPRFGTGLTVNQAHVARALVNSFNTAGGIPLVFGALTPTGLSGASGEAATGIQAATIGVMSRFLGLMTDPYSNGRNASVTEMADLARGPRSVIVAEPARWSAWASGYGGVQALGGNTAIGSHGTSTSIYGSAFGADYRVSTDTVIGFALGAAGTSYRLGQGLGGGSSDVFQIGLYGRHQIGAAYVAAALAYGWQDVTTERRFMGDRLTGRFTANAVSGRIETGYRFAAGFAGLTPYAAGEVVSLSVPGYREQVTSGSGLFALGYAGRSATAWRTELGLRADTAIRIGEAELTLRGRLAWAHNVNPSAIVSASFTSLPASGFVVQGAREAPNALLTSAGAELKWTNGWSAAATFEGSFSGRGSSYAGRGTLRYQW